MRKKGWQVRCFVHQVFEGLVNRSAEFGVVQHHPTTWCVEPVRHRETAHTAHLQVLAADILDIIVGLIRSCLQSGACLDKLNQQQILAGASPLCTCMPCHVGDYRELHTNRPISY